MSSQTLGSNGLEGGTEEEEEEEGGGGGKQEAENPAELTVEEASWSRARPRSLMVSKV